MGVEKRSFWLWPSVANSHFATDANKQGLIASGWCAVTTLFAAVVTHSSFDAYLSVVVYIGVGFAVWKRYRLAAIFGLIFFLYPRVPLWIEYGPKNVLLPAIVSLAFITSARGAFALHKLQKGRAA